MGGVRIARVLPVGHRRWRRAVARGGWVAGVSGGRGGVPRRGGTAGIAPWAIIWSVGDLVDHLEHHCHLGWDGGKGWEVRGFMRGGWVWGKGWRVRGFIRGRVAPDCHPQRRSHLRGVHTSEALSGPQRPSQRRSHLGWVTPNGHRTIIRAGDLVIPHTDARARAVADLADLGAT